MTCLRQQQSGRHRGGGVKELLQELGFFMAKPMHVDVQEGTGVCQAQLGPAWVGRPQPGLQGHIPVPETRWSCSSFVWY